MPTTHLPSITTQPDDAARLMALRTLHLQRRHRISPALAGVIAELALTTTPSRTRGCA